MIHQLKINPEPLQAIIDGNKKAEFRKNDRGFKAGDKIILMEWTPEYGYTGKDRAVLITHTQDAFGIPDGYLMLSIELLPEEKGECEGEVFERELCEHCKMDKSLRNPSGFCDHLQWPDYCETCQKANQGGEKDLEICPKCDKVKYIAKYCECEANECINAPQRCILGYWCKWCRENRPDAHLNDEAVERNRRAITEAFEDAQKPSEEVLVTGKQTLAHVPTALEEFIKRHDEEEREWRFAVIGCLECINKSICLGTLNPEEGMKQILSEMRSKFL